MLTKQVKTDVIGKYRANPKDSGSSAVQIALMSERIKQISAHLKSHSKDSTSQRGLLKLVGHRRRLLAYLERTDRPAYAALIKRLELRK